MRVAIKLNNILILIVKLNFMKNVSVMGLKIY